MIKHMLMEWQSKHKLDFGVSPAPRPMINDGYRWWDFRVGTCTGLFGANKTQYIILAVINNEANNGHFDDVLEWFERSCKRDKLDLVFMHVVNPRLLKHLCTKRGFVIHEKDNVIKSWKKM
jgi:hypothetical protein